jgi:hypothetical protein
MSQLSFAYHQQRLFGQKIITLMHHGLQYCIGRL